MFRAAARGNARSGCYDDGDDVRMDGGICVLWLESAGMGAIALPGGLNQVSARLSQLLTRTEERSVQKSPVADHKGHVGICLFGCGLTRIDLALQFLSIVDVIDHDGKSLTVGAGNGTVCGDVLIDQKQRNILAGAEPTSLDLKADTDALFLMERHKIRRINSMLCPIGCEGICIKMFHTQLCGPTVGGDVAVAAGRKQQ